MKYYVIAGEASGDLHASNLIKEIRLHDHNADVRAWGGDLLEKQGAEIVKHYRDLAFMGFTEVLMNLKTIFRNIEFCKKDILAFRPDCVILVDYPGFNLRIAEFAKQNGYKVIYYISPQVWAWKQSRVKKIRRVVDKMLVILPFEKSFYHRFDYLVDFVGHPLLDAIQEKKLSFPSRKDFFAIHNLDQRPLISLLPGSRKQEIKTMLPLMYASSKKFPDFQFAIAAAPSQSTAYYHSLIPDKNIPVIPNGTYELLTFSEAALVTSGTATLETALLNVPEVVCYKGGFISYLIARKLVKIKFISLVNLIMDKEVVKELIQNVLTEENLTAELKKILEPENRIRIFKDYEILRDTLGGTGASALAADIILKELGYTS
jgi:lipid-A-disaccharide synthase